MKTFSELLESLSGTLSIAPRKKVEKVPQKSFRAMDREHPRYNTVIRGSSMLHADAQHDVIDTSRDTGAPIYGLKEKSHGTTFKYSSHFMDRINNIGESRNKHITGDYIKKVKDAIKQHMDAGNLPETKHGVVKRIFVAKNGYKFPVRIEHGSVHLKTLLSPNMKTDSYTEPRVHMAESEDYSDYEQVYLDF